MHRAHLRFYAELNDLLPESRRQRRFTRAFDLSPSIKDLIESLGVPHTEVDLILVDGQSVGFDYRVQNGDTISVYPVFESLDISPIVRVRPRPLRLTRFVLDVHLGRLATYLRMLGFDTLYRNDLQDEELAHLSRAEERILLTRDQGLLKRNLVTHGYWVRATRPMDQAIEVLRRFDLSGAVTPLCRCLCCNGLLEPVAKSDIAHRLEPGTLACYDAFAICRACDRVYWQGSHYQRMLRLIERLLGEL
ncbi:MAG: twitching motility protein PilT [Chloroflexi bacterium]|nr:twitching motility protein PilT [Chloroflexota bacterium]